MLLGKVARVCSEARGHRAASRLEDFWKMNTARSCGMARGHRANFLAVETGFSRFWVFLGFSFFFFFLFLNVFGCDVGHLKALALIPIDVYVGGEVNQIKLK